MTERTNKIEEVGRAVAGGVRVYVPARVLRELGVQPGDEVVWRVERRDGKLVAVMEKKE